MKRHSGITRIAVTVILFTILFRSIDFLQVVESFRNARPVFFFASLAFVVPNLILQILKWRYILHSVDVRPGWTQIIHSVFGGFFIGAASPGRTGELARGLYIKNESVIKIGSLTIVDKGFNQSITVIVGLISLSLLIPFPWKLAPIFADCLVLMFLFRLHQLEPAIKSFLHKFTESAHVDNSLAAFDALKRGTVLGMLLYSVVFYSVYVLQYYLMILAFVPVPPEIMVRTLPVVYLINLTLPLSFGDFGVKETAAVNLLVPFGITGEAVFGATVLNGVITFLVPSLVGGIMTAFRRPESD